MSITSQITTNLTLGNNTLLVSQGNSVIESVVYIAGTTQTVSFSQRAAIVLTILDYLSYVAQVNTFEKSILNSFNANEGATSQLNSISSSATNAPSICNFDFSKSGAHILSGTVDWVARTVSLANRSNSPNNTLTFAEWVQQLALLNLSARMIIG